MRHLIHLVAIAAVLVLGVAGERASGQGSDPLDGVDESGKPTHVTFTAHYDGKEYPVSGNPDADTIAVKRTDKSSAKSILKKDGKATLTTTRHVSKDGKTLTMTTTGTNAKGEKVDNVLVFDKQ